MDTTQQKRPRFHNGVSHGDARREQLATRSRPAEFAPRGPSLTMAVPSGTFFAYADEARDCSIAIPIAMPIAIPNSKNLQTLRTLY